MSKTKLEEMVLEFLDGNLKPEREIQLKKQLLEHNFDINDLTDLKLMYDELGTIKIPEADTKMTENFYQELSTYKRDNIKKQSLFDVLMLWINNIDNQRLILRAAYSVIILFTGWAIGFWLTPNSKYEKQLDYLASEIREMKTTITVSMLNQSSPGERIKTLNSIANLEKTDDQVITVLLSTLNHDQNVNVRLVALEALIKLEENSRVREGLIFSLGKQNSPLIQLALADFFVSIKDKNVIGQFKQMLLKKELNDVVRQRVSKSLEILI